MESKRLLLATALSIAVVMLYEIWVARQAPPPAPPVPVASPQPTAAAPAAGAVAPAVAPAPAVPGGTVVTVRTAHYEAKFSTAGGTLVEARLLDFKTTLAPNAPPVAIADLGGGALVPTVLAGAGGQPQPLLPPGTLFKAEPASGLTVQPGQQGTLTFTAEGPGGVRVVDRYTFGPGDYAFRLEQTITNGGGGAAALQPAWLLRHRRDLGVEKASGYSAGAVVRTPGGVRRIGFDKLEQPERIPGPIDWAGWQEKYFAGVALPRRTPVDAVIVGQQGALSGAGEVPAGNLGTGVPGPIGQVEVLFPAVSLAPGGRATVTGEVYLGPKEVGALRAVEPTLEQVIDFGVFHWIAMPLLLLLRWLHGFVRNYGLAIILLTILVKVVFWPLTAKQIKSSKQMAKIQPLITAIREKYKDDKEAMNREMMELFKRHNVNPLMGCLPLLVQIPVFFALYQVLNGSIELRHAPFVGWIQDLSAMDPYYVTPVLMGVTSFVTTKMTPSPGMDPAQQKIMLFMPLMMSVIFLWMPSGLVLYWLVQNLLQIGQQVYANRVSA